MPFLDHDVDVPCQRLFADPLNLGLPTQLFRRFSADRLRNTIRRELGTSIAALLSRHLNVRDTVSMVKPR